MESGELHLHHFSTSEVGISPIGSLYFWGDGIGVDPAKSSSFHVDFTPSCWDMAQKQVCPRGAACKYCKMDKWRAEAMEMFAQTMNANWNASQANHSECWPDER